MKKDFALEAGNDGFAPDAPQNYSKGGSKDMGDDKEMSSKPMEMISGGAATGTDGPTTSSRTYPKGKSVDLGIAKKFNPMNGGMPTYGIGGVGAGEK